MRFVYGLLDWMESHDPQTPGLAAARGFQLPALEAVAQAIEDNDFAERARVGFADDESDRPWLHAFVGLSEEIMRSVPGDSVVPILNRVLDACWKLAHDEDPRRSERARRWLVAASDPRADASERNAWFDERRDEIVLWRRSTVR
jgi:hypothetical protein